MPGLAVSSVRRASSWALLSLGLVLLLAPAHAKADGVRKGFDAEVPTPATPFNPKNALTHLVAYEGEHPGFADGLAAWITLGGTVFLVGFCLLLYSEIRTVLVVRDQDFRQKMVRGGYMKPDLDSFLGLTDDEYATVEPRAYWSVGATVIMSAGLAMTLYPFCDVLDIVGLPAMPCLLLLSFLALFATLCIAMFWVGVAWSCTRPAAALVLVASSLAGQLMLPTGNPTLLIIWLAGTVIGLYAYFIYCPALYEHDPSKRPVWLQDVGDFTKEEETRDDIEAAAGAGGARSYGSTAAAGSSTAAGRSSAAAGRSTAAGNSAAGGNSAAAATSSSSSGVPPGGDQEASKRR